MHADFLPTQVVQLSAVEMVCKPQPNLPGGVFGMLWKLLVLLRPFPALYLIALSFLEAVLVFKGGHQVVEQPCLQAGVPFCGLKAYDLHPCSWARCRPILPDHCGSATLFVHQNKSHLSGVVRMQHHCQIHNPMAVRAASVQVCCDSSNSCKRSRHKQAQNGSNC